MFIRLFCVLFFLNFSQVWAQEEEKVSSENSFNPDAIAGASRAVKNWRMHHGLFFPSHPEEASRMPFPTPSSTIEMVDIQYFSWQIFPGTAGDSLLMFLFPNPLEFAPNTQRSDPIASISLAQWGALSTLVADTQGKIRSSSLVTHEKAFWEEGLCILNLQHLSEDALEEDMARLPQFYRWEMLFALSRRCKQLWNTIPPSEKNKLEKKFAGGDLFVAMLNNIIPGFSKVFGIETGLSDFCSAGAHRSFEHSVYADTPFSIDPSTAFRQFERYRKRLGKLRFLALLWEGLEHEAYDTRAVDPLQAIRAFVELKYQEFSMLGREEGPSKEMLLGDPESFYALPLRQQNLVIQRYGGVFNPFTLRTVTVDPHDWMDCVEITLLNALVGCRLSFRDGIFLRIAGLPEGSPLRLYLEENLGLLAGVFDRNSWAAAISGLPNANYVKKTAHEMRPGFVSFLNTAFHVLGSDKTLERNDDRPLLEASLSTLAEILTEEGHVISFEPEDNIRWNAHWREFLGDIIVLENGQKIGKIHYARIHGQFRWERGEQKSPIVEAIIGGATDIVRLTMAAPMVNSVSKLNLFLRQLHSTQGDYAERRFAAEAFELKPEHRPLVLQMDLSSASVQRELFGRMYKLPYFQDLALSLLANLSHDSEFEGRDVLQYFDFLWDERIVPPKSTFLKRLLRVSPRLFTETVRARGQPYSLFKWCLEEKHDALFDYGMQLAREFRLYNNPGEVYLEKIVHGLSRAPSLRDVHIPILHEDEHPALWPVLMKRLMHDRRIGNVALGRSRYQTIMALISTMPWLDELEFSLLMDGSAWSDEGLRHVVLKFLEGPPEEREDKTLTVSGFESEESLMAFLKRLPHDLLDSEFLMLQVPPYESLDVLEARYDEVLRGDEVVAAEPSESKGEEAL